MNEPAKPSLLERLSSLLLREPEDREQLIALLHGAFERRLLDAEALSMIEGVLQVSETQVRDVMIPRSQMDMIDAAESPERFIPFAIETAHSRFPVFEDNRDNVVGILLAKDLLRFYAEEEFNLRGALTAAQVLQPDIAVQIDLLLATDTPDMGYRGDVRLGAGPAMSLYSFHGRGTLNGTLPHPALVALFEATSRHLGMNLQRSAHVGALTDSSYVQLVGSGVASIDLGFPMRYSHSSLEVCDLGDLEGLTQLLVEGIAAIDGGFSLDRDDYIE